MMSEEQSGESKKTIIEMMDSFKKHLWSSDKPMEFATDVVEEMLLEIQRQQTVMRAAADEIRRHWAVHSESEGVSLHQLQNLVASLTGQRKGFYAQYLSPIEYHEFVLRQSSFDSFVQGMAATEGVVSGAEKEGSEDAEEKE